MCLSSQLLLPLLVPTFSCLLGSSLQSYIPLREMLFCAAQRKFAVLTRAHYNVQQKAARTFLKFTLSFKWSLNLK